MAESRIESPLLLGAIILAAGGSSRMGSPKQLLSIAGLPLIARCVRAVVEARIPWIVVVLGHAADQIRPVLQGMPVTVVTNDRWADGIGSSIHLGIQTLDSLTNAAAGTLLTVGDQPHLSTRAIGELIAAFRSPNSLIASQYEAVVGTPAIFGRSYFPELRGLPVEAGAQRLLRAHREKVIEIRLPELAVDLDTPEDYRRFLDAEGGP